jgi:predicted adenine nucleotide alpha hydrolase (AANH) superfamily ATPase
MESRESFTRLALHACCGPCLLEPLDALLAEAGEVVIVFSNSNIHPGEEYARRRDTLLAYATQRGIRTVALPYRPDEWSGAVAEANSKEERCAACYRLRLQATADWAAEHECDAMATTLTVSPYQDPERIRAEAERAAVLAGIAYVGRDFRERYHAATARSRELGMYRQNYCGCAMSEAEARIEREERKAARRR